MYTNRPIRIAIKYTHNLYIYVYTYHYIVLFLSHYVEEYLPTPIRSESDLYPVEITMILHNNLHVLLTTITWPEYHHKPYRSNCSFKATVAYI